MASRKSATVGFVLVHGGSHTAACWDAVIPLLRRPAIAVDLPGRGGTPGDLRTLTVEQCAVSVIEAMDASEIDRFVVVGHSMAGITIPEVAARAPERVAHLVFLACAVPAAGRSIVDSVPLLFRPFQRHRARTKEPLTLPSWLLKRLACTDMTPEQTADTLAHIVPESSTIMLEAVDRSALPDTTPLTWILTTRDRTLPPRQQRRYIANLPAPRVVAIDTGHNAFTTRPAELAFLLDAIGDEAAGASESFGGIGAAGATVGVTRSR